MEKEFLLGLADLSEEAVEAILAEHGKEVSAWQGKYRQAELQWRLGTAIAAAGGRNHKAIAALLDTDALADADETAITQAVEQVKRDCGYLFCTAVPFAPGTGAVQQKTEKNGSLADALRERFGK